MLTLKKKFRIRKVCSQSVNGPFFRVHGWTNLVQCNRGNLINVESPRKNVELLCKYVESYEKDVEYR